MNLQTLHGWQEQIKRRSNYGSHKFVTNITPEGEDKDHNPEKLYRCLLPNPIFSLSHQESGLILLL